MLETVNITSLSRTWANELQVYLPACESIGTATGIGLFFDINSAHIQSDSRSMIITQVIERVVELLQQQQSAFLTIELTEFLHFLDHCDKASVPEAEINNLSLQIEALIAEQAVRLIEKEQFDPYIGGFYQLYYFLISGKRKDIVKQGIDLLKQQSKYLENQSAYFNSRFREGELCLSITHGVSFYLQYLCICFEKGLLSDLKLIDAYARFLFLQCDEQAVGSSFFPDYLNEARNSRLCLCYGDAGILFSLWKAYRLLGNQEMLTRIETLIEKTTNRVDEESTGVIDYSLLYGSAGLYLFYQNYYRRINKQSLHTAAKFWKEKALDQASSTITSLFETSGGNTPSKHLFNFQEGLTGALAACGARNWVDLQKLHFFFYLN